MRVSLKRPILTSSSQYVRWEAKVKELRRAAVDEINMFALARFDDCNDGGRVIMFFATVLDGLSTAPEIK